MMKVSLNEFPKLHSTQLKTVLIVQHLAYMCCAFPLVSGGLVQVVISVFSQISFDKHDIVTVLFTNIARLENIFGASEPSQIFPT